MDSPQLVGIAARSPAPDRADRMIDALRCRIAAVPQTAGAAVSAATAAAAFALFDRHLKHSPCDPAWVDRDRLVFGGAEAGALAQALLQLSGYAAPVGEPVRIGRPRPARTCRLAQLASTHRAAPALRTKHAVAIVKPREALATAVGLAIAEQRLSATFGDGCDAIVDHRSYAFVDEDCLAGPLAAEACDIAGELRLGKLVVLCHDRHQTQGGADPASYFARSGWQVIGPLYADDVDAIDAALHAARDRVAQPTALVLRDRAERSSPGDRTSDARACIPRVATASLPHDDAASIPCVAAASTAAHEWSAHARGRRSHRDWQRRFDAWQHRNPALAAEFDRRMRADPPNAMPQTALSLVTRFARREMASTHDASNAAFRTLGAQLPEIQQVPGDVRCAATLANAIALHGGFVPHVVHAAAPDQDTVEALRSTARQRRHVVHVFGGDAARFDERSVAALDSWHPCDGAEAAVASSAALEQRGRTTALFVCDEPRAPCRRTPEQLLAIGRGGYVIEDRPHAVALLVASGRSVYSALEAQRRLDARGIAVRVVSMPSRNVFDRQDETWRERVLPAQLPQWAIGSDADVESVLWQLRANGAMRAA